MPEPIQRKAPIPESQGHVGSTDLLLATAQDQLDGKPPLQEKDAEVFQWEVEDFFHTQQKLFQDAIDKGHPQPALKARSELIKRFVNEAEFKELGQLCNLLALFPIFAAQQHRHEEIMQEIRHSNNPVGGDKKAKLKKEMYQIRDNLIGYNHLMRDFLVENGSYIDRKQLENWFARMNRHVAGPGQAIIKGVSAEVAVIRFIQSFDEELDIRVRPGTVEEDRRGIDLVIYKHGRTIGIDIKTGGQQSFGMTSHEELNVEQSQLRNFDLSPDGKRDIIGQISSL